ncbi:TPA: hypothetical protein ACH3X2_002931 [Trebouxia sp. C0005]|nr:MAG: hypothetical protein FRX49_11328 [Trebouxia sp. A1-2]
MRVAVIEALRGNASPLGTSDTFAELTMTGEPAARKRRKFQLVTTVDDTHAVSTGDILLKLRTRRQFSQGTNLRDARSELAAQPEVVNGSSIVTGTYRQIHDGHTSKDAVQQEFTVYDIVHEAPDHAHQIFRGPNKAEIMAHYYPLVQAYLQQHNQQTQPSAQNPSSDEYVFDYYTTADGDQIDTETDTHHTPVVQVQDFGEWHEAEGDSEAGQSEDSNAENWYGNDYPEDDESTASDRSRQSGDDIYSSDD